MKSKKVLQIVRALDFAAWAHSSQRRKGGEGEPYINHLTEVSRLVAQATGGKDATLIIAALLHDVLEDQGKHVNYEMLVGNFGKRVAKIVREVTDDMSLPKAERKRLQIEHAPHLSRRAKILKIADKAANLNSIIESPPKDWSVQRKREYFAWAAEVVAGCRGVNPWIESVFDERLGEGNF
ncbi:HD domain-containing protein [Propionivibrio soli]|uniref:HD domain-containing protein n=1 Tax=Propionivibrio soli TaxID=2976531 RepID=UPI0021E92657|nr:HD domain-containing protein [Propionivibrio soli]